MNPEVFEPLSPEGDVLDPSGGKGALIGYARVSTRDQNLGRAPAVITEQLRRAHVLLTRPDESVSSVARLLVASRTTLYKHVSELGQGSPIR